MGVFLLVHVYIFKYTSLPSPSLVVVFLWQNQSVKRFRSLDKLKGIVWGDSGRRVRSRPEHRRGPLSVADQVCFILYLDSHEVLNCGAFYSSQKQNSISLLLLFPCTVTGLEFISVLPLLVYNTPERCVTVLSSAEV